MNTPLFGSQPASPTSSAAQPVQIAYVAQPGLGSIAISNFFLNLITLWIYRFWAKTRVRRHIWSSVHVNGEPLEYTGTGKELFLGFVIVLAVIFLPLALIGVALSVYYGPKSAASIAYTYLIALALSTMYGFAIYRARRYRLSRTLWRGIRGALPGSAISYSGKYFGSLLLSPITAGWSSPAMNLILAEQMTNDMRFGNTPFSFTGRAGPLYTRYALCWFLTLFVYLGLIGIAIGLYSSGAFDSLQNVLKAIDGEGNYLPDYMKGLIVFAGFLAIILFLLLFATLRSIIWSFYTAKELNLFAQYTRFPGTRFEFNATPWSLITLWLGNMALIIFTLGIAQPFVEQRIMRYFVDRLTIEGAVDFSSVGQSQAAIDKRGEGLIDALNLDAF